MQCMSVTALHTAEAETTGLTLTALNALAGQTL